MFNSARPNPASRPVRPTPPRYRLAEFLMLILAFVVAGWGLIGSTGVGWAAAPASVPATGPAVNYPLYAWGANNYGQLGNGTINNSSSPVTVSLPAGVAATAIAAGCYHTLAIGNDSKLYAWGNNQYGELGNGTTSTNPTSTPMAVKLPAGVMPTAITAGYNHSLATGSDGKLYTWGYNQFGQLGNGTTTNSSTPLIVGSVAGIVHPLLAAGSYHSLVLFPLPPTQIAATSGSPQSATVGAAFASPLIATVRNVNNNPVSSVVVTFTAPVSEASGTFAGGSPVYTATTDASGNVTATVTANTLPGSYSITASVSDVTSSVG